MSRYLDRMYIKIQYNDRKLKDVVLLKINICMPTSSMLLCLKKSQNCVRNLSLVEQGQENFRELS